MCVWNVKRCLVATLASIATMLGPPVWAQSEGSPTAGTAAATASAVVGPKKRVAVAKFDANGAFVGVYGGWDIGGGLAAQLTTALMDAGRFIVVERPDLGVVLKEQELAQLRATQPGTGPQAGKVLGAEYIIRGSVTEFEQNAGGQGVSVGVGLLGRLGGALSSNTTRGVVAIDLRVIDATTGQVVQSRRVEKKTSTSETSVTLTSKDVNLGSEQFNKTVLGQAVRGAIEEAVGFVGQALDTIPWMGSIADVSGDKVYLNAGREIGIKPGDRFEVLLAERVLTDPASGAKLGTVWATLGRVIVRDAQNGFSVASMEAPFDAKRGDTVRFLTR